jgi:hypothetical protein
MQCMLSRRALLAGGLTAFAHGYARPAGATLVRPVTLTELVQMSRHRIVGTPLTASSRWETLGGSARIVTYTEVRVDYPLDGGAPAASSLVVRTLGGAVGDIGQVVPGEAPLRKGATAALFLENVKADVFAVTAMAQGHYTLYADEQGTNRVRANAFTLRGAPSEAAVIRLDGRKVVDVESLVYQEVARGSR